MGRYKKDKLISRTGNSTIHKCINERTGKPVAIKEYRNGKDYLADKEIYIMKQILKLEPVKSLQFIQYYTSERGRIIMEYIPCDNLYQYISKNFPSGISEELVKPIFRKIVTAIDILHDINIAHRDIKLENIMYNPDTEDLKIIDLAFGTRIKRSSGKLILHDVWCGTLYYTAPEIFMHEKYDSSKIDIWSLGIVLYVLLTGESPFDGPDRTEVKKAVFKGKYIYLHSMSEPVRNLLDIMFNQDPKKRPNTKDLLNHEWMK